MIAAPRNRWNWAGFLFLALVLPFLPGDSSSWKDAAERPQPPLPIFEGSGVVLEQRFTGGDGETSLAGCLYVPATNQEEDGPDDGHRPPPVVLMAHGLGLTQASGLAPFAEAFLEEGWAVFTLDYATFGRSDGWPRHQVRPGSHVADLRAALGYLRSSLSKEIDADRIGLWGTSLGGGHVLALSSLLREDGDESIKAVVSLVPHTASGLESVLGALGRDPLTVLGGALRVAGGVLKGAIWGFREALYLPLTGPPGSSALMQNPGDEEGYLGLARSTNTGAEPEGWTNAATTGSALRVLFYRPLDHIRRSQGSGKAPPTLLLPAEHDTLCPAEDSKEAARLLGPSARVSLQESLGHFGVYGGEPLRRVLSETVSFLKQHL